MSRVSVDIAGEAKEAPFVGNPDPPDEEEEAPKARRQRKTTSDVAVEQEITKRHIIDAVSRIVVVILYMVFTLVREREAGVVVLDGSDGPEDDWDES